MNLRNYLILGMAFSMALSSCKKEDPIKLSEDPFEAPYSELTVEDNKTNLEDAGVDMVEEMDVLMESDAIDIANNFSEIAENLMGDKGSNAPVAPMQLTASIENGKSDQIIMGLKSVSEDPNSISEAWDENTGTYSWNANTEDWDFTEGVDEIIIKFPGMEGDLTNTATYRVYAFSYIDVPKPAYEIETDSMDLQLPTSLKASLSYNGTELVTYDFTATYQADGIPTMVKTSLAIEKFVFSYEINHTLNKSVAATYALKHDSKTLIELHADVSGDWSEDSIDKHVIDHREFMYVDIYTGDSIFDEWTEPIVEKILSESNAYVQILNIKVAASVNAASLGKEVRSLEEEYENNTGTKEYNDKLALAMNENAKLVAVYVDSEKKIAGVEAYSYLDEDDQDPQYDIDLRFVFGDESKVDAETYFNDGFSSLVDDINTLIADINADYNTEMEPIEY